MDLNKPTSSNLHLLKDKQAKASINKVSIAPMKELKPSAFNIAK